MPTTKETLKGELFDIYYKKNYLLITNEAYRGAEGGRKIKA